MRAVCSKAAGFIDIHQHVLYGVDDGPEALAEMKTMLDAAVRDGVEAIIATPHARPGMHAFDRELCRERLFCARAYCQERRYALHVLEGAALAEGGRSGLHRFRRPQSVAQKNADARDISARRG